MNKYILPVVALGFLGIYLWYPDTDNYLQYAVEKYCQLDYNSRIVIRNFVMERLDGHTIVITCRGD